MKKFVSFTAAVLVIVLSSAFMFKTSAQYRDDVSYKTFYDELSPHGNWIEYPEHGYVWQPRMGNDFRPYSTGGHWVWSDQYEWMWVSDYDWGWAPFHYGRWFSDPSYGWLWVPGYEWSSAWVAWRDGGDYYGWAPIRPGINISVNFNIGSYSPPYDYWCFTPRRYITSRNVFNHYIDRRQNVTIINQTTIINNYNYGGGYGYRTGPRRIDAERYTGRINPVRLRDSYNPGRTQFRNNEVSVYRPAFRSDNRNIAPRQFERYDRNNTVGNNRTNDNDNGFRRNNADVPSNNNTVRQPQSNNGSRRLERNNSDVPGATREQGIRTQPTDRPINSNGETRRFDRNNRPDQPNRSSEIRTPRTNQPNSNPEIRTPRTRPADRPVNTQQTPRDNSSRTFERQRPNNQQPGGQNREVRTQNQPRPQGQQMQQRQPQPRMERNSSGSQPQRNSGGGNGNGKKFERRTN